MFQPWLDQKKPPIEQLGTFDPMVNQHNEKLVAFNYERVMFWLGQGNVNISPPVEELFGLAGFLPIHPRTYIRAWRARKTNEENEKKAKEESNNAEKEIQSN